MYSFTTVPGKLPTLFKKIKDTGVPKKVTIKWLESMGLKAKNDRTMIPVLKMLGFIDGSGVPTEVWRNYRGPNGDKFLYDSIKNAYKDLYDMFPDACNRDKKEVEDFLRAHSDAGNQSIQKSASTFFKLCEIANVDNKNFTDDIPENLKEVENGGGDNSTTSGRKTLNEISETKSVCINVNLQITLPETTDEKVYDSIFKSMKKYLIV